MDIREYYRKVRELASTIPTREVVVVSLETPAGGRAGVMTEVTREAACRLVVEGKARLATDEESREFQAAKRATYQEAMGLTGSAVAGERNSGAPGQLRRNPRLSS